MSHTFEYLVDGRKFGVSYSDLRQQYIEIVSMSADEFEQNIARALHAACIISWLKCRGQHAVSDLGCVHEIAHHMHNPDTRTLQTAMEAFKRDCELSA